MCAVLICGCFVSTAPGASARDVEPSIKAASLWDLVPSVESTKDKCEFSFFPFFFFCAAQKVNLECLLNRQSRRGTIQKRSVLEGQKALITDHEWILNGCIPFLIKKKIIIRITSRWLVTNLKTLGYLQLYGYMHFHYILFKQNGRQMNLIVTWPVWNTTGGVRLSNKRFDMIQGVFFFFFTFILLNVLWPNVV